LKVFAPLLLVTLVGCGSMPPPVDVNMVPNDCSNQTAVVRWLEDQSRFDPPPLANKDQYAQHRSAIRNRIWRLRYTCNPV